MKDIVDYVKNKTKQNIFNTFISCIAVSILSFIILLFLLFPLVIVNGFMGIVGICINFLAILLSFCCVFLLHYGFFVILGKIYNNEKVILGNIFDGFRDFRRLFPFAFIFSLVFLGATVLLSFCFEITLPALDTQTLSTLPVEELLSYVTIQDVWVKILGIYAVISLIFFICSSFVWCILIENQSERKILQVFKQSLSLVKGNVFRFLSFLIRCCFFPFLLILLCLSVNFFTIPDFILQIAHFCYTALYFFVIIRLVFAIWGFYCYKRGTFLLLPDASQEINCNDAILSLENSSTENVLDDEK